jgi:hypothetical protein
MFLLAKGDWLSAIHLHALSPFVFVLLFAAILGMRPPRVLRPYVMQSGAVLMAAYGIARL